jgi:hypothetical protein
MAEIKIIRREQQWIQHNVRIENANTIVITNQERTDKLLENVQEQLSAV